MIRIYQNYKLYQIPAIYLNTQMFQKILQDIYESFTNTLQQTFIEGYQNVYRCK